MGDAVPLLAGAIVAAFVTLGVLRARRESRMQGVSLTRSQAMTDVLFVALGAVLIAGALVVGERVLDVEEPPRGQLFGAGVGIAPEVRARPGRGFVSGLAARFRSCDDPVEVTVALAGTAEYFQDNATRLRGPVAFTVGIPSKEVTSVRVSHTVNAGAVVTPLHAAIGGQGALGAGAVEGAAAGTRRSVTAVRGRVTDWGRNLATVIVKFEAEWLERRGLGSCYLKLPALSGNATILGAQDARGLGRARARDIQGAAVSTLDGDLAVPYDPALSMRRGLAVVDAGKNQREAMQPDANAVSSNQPALTCQAPEITTAVLGTPGASTAGQVFAPAGSGGALSTRGRDEAIAGERDCSGVVTLAEASADTRRDLVLLLEGAGFSMGAALIFEILLGFQRRRVVRREAT